ncbi:MAG TPA: hypothetical protein VGN00_18980 [Puia sp.]|jgi:hypothetical protein
MPTKLLLSLVLILTLFAGYCPRQAPVSTQQTEYVYLCEGPYSKVYHRSTECRGLAHCSTKIDKVTLAEAVKMGRRPCKIEYR